METESRRNRPQPEFLLHLRRRYSPSGLISGREIHVSIIRGDVFDDHVWEYRGLYFCKGCVMTFLGMFLGAIFVCGDRVAPN